MISEGFQGDAKKERAFEKLAASVEAYQKRAGYFDLNDLNPKSIAEAIRVEMKKRNLTQSQIAKLLEIPDSRLSELLNKRRPLSLTVAKRLHKRLNINANFLLEHA